MTADSWKASAARRRDERATKVPDAATAGPSKKNTRKWCRGKVGVEHKPECRDYRLTKRPGFSEGYAKGWKILVCTECGKELAHYYPFGHEKKNPPAWVIK